MKIKILFFLICFFGVSVSFLFFLKSKALALDCSSCANIVDNNWCPGTGTVTCTGPSAPAWTRAETKCCRDGLVPICTYNPYSYFCDYYSPDNCVTCYNTYLYYSCTYDCYNQDCCSGGNVIAGHCETSLGAIPACWFGNKYKVCCRPDGTEVPCSKTGDCPSQYNQQLCPAGSTITAPGVTTCAVVSTPIPTLPPGVTPPPPTSPPSAKCTFSACGAYGCGSRQRWVSGDCWSYSWFGGDGCYNDDSCGDDNDCSGEFSLDVPDSICIEDNAKAEIIQHQESKFDTFHVEIDHIGGLILPDGVIVCEAKGCLSGACSCTWDTMHIEKAHNYNDFNQKLPTGYKTGPYPTGAYRVSVYYSGKGDCDPQTVVHNTNLQYCLPSCSGLTTSSGTIVYGNSVTLTANISNYGLIYGGRCPDSNPACRAVQTTPAFQRIQYGGPSFSTTYTPSTSTGGGGKYVFEVTAYDSTACKYACTAGQIYYRENTGLGNCTASGVWTNIGSCTSTGCLKYVTVNTPTPTLIPTPTPIPPIPTPTFIPTPTPRPQVSWFQTTGGDIQSQGDITSIIPDCAASEYLSKRGEGGSPGVVGYYDSLSIGTVGEVSETHWQAKTRYNGGDMKFDYLKNRLKVDTTKVLPGSDIPTVSGTYYLDSEMSLNLNGGAIPNGRKIVIFVTSNVTVTGNITVASGGFFALISKGNITFDDTATQADGFYLSDEAITVAEGISPFSGQGSFIGWGGISFLRDLIDNCSPAEAFIERPDFFINAPDEFKITNSYFKEIEP